jgi:hypothetical protein
MGAPSGANEQIEIEETRRRKGLMKSNRFAALTAAAAALIFIGASPAAHGALIVLAPAVIGAPGTSGTFDIVLQNTGAASISIGGFSFGVSTTNPGVTFSSATISTTAAAYIFGADSLFGPDITIASGTSLSASDNPASVASYNVAGGATVGLGHLSYAISGAATPGTLTLSLSPSATALADQNGNPIKIDALTDGSVSVTGTPEPGGFALVLSGGTCAAAAGLRTARRRRRIRQ